MAFKRNKIRFKSGSDEESTYDLDLSPMLALMVTLIPIMLLATVFVKVTIIESALPQVVQKAIEEDRNNKNKKISIQLNMKKNKSFYLNISKGKRSRKSIKISSRGGQWDLNRLHTQLVTIKQKYPRTFRIDLVPAESVSYEDIVKVIDEARGTKSEDPKLYIRDKESNKRVETTVMFPDIIFSNVVGG